MKLESIRLLTDENISPKVLKSLRDQGLDVLDVKEEGWCGKEDQELLDIAFENHRFVLTHDSDFGTLAMNEGRPCYGLLYLWLADLKPDNVARICQRLFSRDLDVYSGTILVIEETRIRIRHSSHE
jgi:predicted nuclease of predicted toxin-antitoxin system